MLQNAYFLAKIGADTAENEQHFAEICQNLATTLRVRPSAGSRALLVLLALTSAWYLGAGAQLKQRVGGPLCGTVRELLYTCEHTNERTKRTTDALVSYSRQE